MIQQQQDLQAQLEALRAENAMLKATQGQRTLSWKVSEKGAVSIYGAGRFPITIYAKTLLALLDKQAELRSFIEQNRSKLSWEKATKA